MSHPPRPSPAARAAVAAFRERGRLSDDTKAALRRRIDASIADRAEPEAPSDAAPIDVAASAWRIGVALAAAAGVLLTLRVVGSAGMAEREASPSSDQAVYEAAPGDDSKELTRPRAEPRASTPAAPPPSLPPAPATERPVPDPTPPAPRTPARAEAGSDGPEPPAPTLEADLAAELAVMRLARAALRREAPEEALRLLDEHAARFASGQMLEDRQALRVQALCDAGRGDQARAAARRFAQAHPGSPHAARVKKICIES